LSPEQRFAMGQAGRARVQARFSDGLVIRAYLDALGDLAPRRS